jgi:hypothetical protein
MVRRVRLLCGLTLGGAVLVSACTKSPEAKAKEAATALASWQATVRLLEKQRARGALPEPFVRQVLRAAAEGREQATAQRRAAGAP